MGKNKLKKFDDLQGYPHVFQYPFSALQEKGFEMQGKWGKQFFKNENPIVLELGCGKGEYAVGLAKRYPQKNFIGIDIKGARMWSGAKQALEEGINNVAFLRTNIELIDRFFAKGEVSEIWITFPDPQMKKVRKRLTSTRFMQLYQNILSPEGLIHLKSDSPFMYTYTCEMVKANGYPVQVWLERGMNIKYIRFVCQPREQFIEPDVDIPYDTYRSFNRGKRSGKQSSQENTTSK